MIQLNEVTWSRICPTCDQPTTHKNRAKCLCAEKLKTTCSSCSAKQRGKKRSAHDLCPICKNEFRVLDVQEHSELHSTTPQLLWLLKHSCEIPKCRCGCGESTNWANWKKGFSEFLNGHNGSIYTSYDLQKAKEISDKRRSKLIGKVGWAKNQTMENNTIIKNRAQASAAGIRKTFAEGRIAWSKGLTKETNPAVASMAKNLKEGFANGTYKPWAKGLTKETNPTLATMAMNVSFALKQKELHERLTIIKRLTKSEILDRIKTNSSIELLDDLSPYLSLTSTNINVKCKLCNETFKSSINNLVSGNRCYICSPAWISSGQSEIINFVKSLNFSPLVNDRSAISPLELDIYVPERRFAIEYNGLYWHSELNKSAIYHDNKTNKCLTSDVRLFHVFQDEWGEKSDIVKSMIKHRLGIFDRVIGARKCTIHVLNNRQRIEFFEKNHIDDDSSAGMCLGLIHNDELVAALSLRKAFHKKYEDALEVARFCTKTFTAVPGALSRLTSHAKIYASSMGYKRLITYVDSRLGTGEAYKKAGFSLVSNTKPRFWWTDMKYRFNRFKFRADPKNNMTEAQVAGEAGVVKIWGCKNYVFELIIE